MVSAACEWIATNAAMQNAIRFTRDRQLRYGVAAGEAGGAGEPKLKFTVGAFSAPCWAAKNGRGANPNIPVIVLVGKRRTAVLKSCTAPLKLLRSTEIRFSVPSSCA